MKIRWYDRILLFIVAVFLAASALLFVAAPLMGGLSQNIGARITNLPFDRTGTILLVAGGAILAVLAAYLFSIAFAKKRIAAPKSVLMRQGEIGSIEINLCALDTLVQKCARGFSSVKDCKSSIAVTQYNDIAVLVRLSIMPDVEIPDLTSRLQTEMKQYVENFSGIPVREVRVIVESAGVNPAARVQ